MLGHPKRRCVDCGQPLYRRSNPPSVRCRSCQAHRASLMRWGGKGGVLIRRRFELKIRFEDVFEVFISLAAIVVAAYLAPIAVVMVVFKANYELLEAVFNHCKRFIASLDRWDALWFVIMTLFWFWVYNTVYSLL
jgi:hypothetical protein